MEFLRTPDPGASVALWATPGGTANVSSVTPAAAGADHSGHPSLDRAGIKSSFQTLFSPKSGTTPAVLSRGQTVPSLTPFIGGTTPNLVTPALGILSSGPSPRADIPLPNVSNRGLPTPDMMRSPYLQAAAKEAVRREFLNMPSYITATDVSAASEQTVPENEFSSGLGQGQQKLVFAKDGAPVPPNAFPAFSRQDVNIPLPQTASVGNQAGINGNSGTRNLGDKNAVGVSEHSMYAGSMGFDVSKSSGVPRAGKSPNEKSSESNQRVPRVNASLQDANSQSHGRDASDGSTLPSNSQAQSASQSEQPQQQTTSQRIQQYPQQPVAPFPVNQAQLQSQQQQQPYAAFPPTGQPSFNPVQAPPGMFLMGQPPMVVAAHPPHGTQLFAHPSGALMMFAAPGTAPHAVMQPHPGIMMHSGHQQHLVHPSAPSVKPETAEERRERVEREKQELIREFKKKTREAALVRFRQKRRERRFGKLIRYDCRKKLADARPRVKGRFVRIRGDDLDEEEDESEQAQVVPSLDE